VPLLFEVGSESQFDRVVVVTAPAKLRRARSLAADDQREQRLLDDREKAARADYVYTNTGTLEELDRFVGSVMHDLTS
jgi:dephospho-CoA kinase